MRARKNWKKAMMGLSKKDDPWGAMMWDDIVMENGIRHRYNPLSKTWTKEKVVVKMEDESFGKGAMRECFRM